MEAEEEMLHVTFVARNGHRRYDPAWKDRLVSAGLEAGVSVSRLALDHGVNANLLRKWIKQRGQSRSLPQPSPSAFIPVEIASTANLAALRQGGCPSTPWSSPLLPFLSPFLLQNSVWIEHVS